LSPPGRWGFFYEGFRGVVANSPPMDTFFGQDTPPDPVQPVQWLALLVEDVAGSVHHGRPGLSAAAKTRWIRRIREALAEPARGALVREAAHHPLPVVREVAAGVLATLPAEDWAEGLLRELASDDDWEVREWAVEPLQAWVDRDPGSGTARIQAWLKHGGRLRRAALLALRARVLNGALPVPEALALVESAWRDSNPYIVENLGSFVLGDACLRRDPDATLDWLRQQVASGIGTTEARHLARLLKTAVAAQYRLALIPIAEAAYGVAPPAVARSLQRWLSREPPRDTP
jgi:hypothetical protein